MKGINNIPNTILRSNIQKINPKTGSNKRLMEISREFEALLIHQMLKAMRSSIPESPFSSQGEKIFIDLLDQEYAKQMASVQSFGLARMIYEQLAPSDQR